MRDSRVLMTQGDKRKNDANTDKLYTAMSYGKGVNNEMREKWKKKPYYILNRKDEKNEPTSEI